MLVTAEFDEPVQGFQLQYVSPGDFVYNDIQLDEIETGTGTYRWVESGLPPQTTSDIEMETDPAEHYVTYRFRRGDGSYYELVLDANGNSLAIIFFTPAGLDDSDYSQAVQLLIQDANTHLFVTDAAGNTSDDLLHE